MTRPAPTPRSAQSRIGPPLGLAPAARRLIQARKMVAE
jgi:hypothetical protein